MTREAFRAVVALLLCAAATGASAALSPEGTREAQALIAQLGAEKFDTREAAVEKLIAMGPDAVPLVRTAMGATDDPEVRTRCGTVLERVRLVERTLADLGPYEPVRRGREYYASTDGAAWACIAAGDGKQRLIVNGRTVAEHAAIESPAFSADGKHFACWANGPKGWFIVHDGAEGPAWEARGTWPRFSADGLRLAYVARKGDKRAMIIDGKEGPWYDDINQEEPWFEGGHFLYAAKKDGKWLIVADGVEGPPHDRIVLPDFCRSRAYAAVDGIEMHAMECDWPAEPGRGPLVERQGKLLGALPREAPGRENFLVTAEARAALIAYTIEKGPGAVHHGGQDYLVAHGWQIGPQGKHVAAMLKKDAGEFVLFDGVEGPLYDEVNVLLFSRDGEHCVYTARRGAQWVAVLDGKEGPAFDHIPPWGGVVIAFSNDGAHLAYLAMHGEQMFVILNGAEKPAPEGTESIVFSPDGLKVLCVVHDDEKRYLQADDRRTPDYTSVQAEFSRDGKHLRYAAQAGGRAFMVCDGIKGPEHDNVHWIDHGAETAGAFRYLVLDRGRQKLVEVDWPSSFDWTNSLRAEEP